MKLPIWKWGFPEHQLMEKPFQNFKTKIFEKWKIETTDQNKQLSFPLIPEISDKQKDSIRDIFAHIAIKRISFQNEKRIYYSLGRYWAKWKKIEPEIKIAEVILFPIQAKEIQDILSQAQQFDIAIRAFNQWQEKPLMNFPKNKFLGMIHFELMHKILRFEPDFFHITVQPGVKIQVLQKFLKEQGWELDIDIIGQEHLNIFELLHNHSRIASSVLQLEIHTPAGLLLATKNNGYIQHYFSDLTLGIPSEITLKIQPLAKYTRKIEAQLKDIHHLTRLIEQINLNNIVFNKLYAFDYSNNSLVDALYLYKVQDEQPIDFFNNFIKKSEEILFKDETERPIFIAIEFQEYQFSISSLLLKVKDLILQLDGKFISYNLIENLNQWRKNYPYFDSDAEENKIDSLHFYTLVPLDKMEDFQKSVRKKLEKNNFYPSKKSDDLLLFTHLPSSLIQVDFYFFGTASSRKTEDAFSKMSDYFNELFHSDKQMNYQHDKALNINDEIWNSIKKLTDPKNILNNIGLSTIPNSPKKN